MRRFDTVLEALALASILGHVWASYNAGYERPDLDNSGLMGLFQATPFRASDENSLGG